MKKIFIDPGHGGKDSGAVANGLLEKEIVLDIAKRIEDLLQDYEGIQVKLSRSDDRFIELTERARMANQWEADYFVSIHVNAGGGTGYEDFIYNGDVSNTTISNQNTMNAEISKITGLTNRGTKRGNFAVLRQTKMKSILTENGFIDNVNDVQLLKQSSFIDKVAQGHVNGLVKIFNLKKKVKTSPLVSAGPFPDVLSNDSGVKAIEFVKKEGLMQGYPDGTFKPNDTVTRRQLAQVLSNVLNKS